MDGGGGRQIWLQGFKIKSSPYFEWAGGSQKQWNFLVIDYFFTKDEGGATAAVLTSLSSLVLMLQLIMNIANSNNNRKNENNNNNNDNNNNNINEGITLLLNEYTNEVMATGNGVGRELFTDDDFEVRFKHS